MCEDCHPGGRLPREEPDLTPEEEEEQALRWEREHLEQVHGGGDCDCPPIF